MIPVKNPRAIISKESLVKNFNIQDGRGLYWTDDTSIELPILIQPNDTIPIRTIPQVFQEVVKQTPNAVALRVKRKRNPDDTQQSYLKWTWK